MEIWTSLVTKASTSRADHVGEQFALIGSLQVGVDYPCREPFIFTRLANWGKLDNILPSSLPLQLFQPPWIQGSVSVTSIVI